MVQLDAASDNTDSRVHGAAEALTRAPSLRRAAARVRALVAVALVVTSHGVSGYTEERALAYFARELAECSAWYALVAEAPGLDEVTRIRFRAVASSLVSTAADIATEPWALTQLNLAATNIRREMRGSWKNYALVDKEYGQRCREVATDPVARQRYWQDRYK